MTIRHTSQGIACLLASHGLDGPSLYSRVLDCEPLAGEQGGGLDVSGELLLEHGLRPYETALRSQIRQAVRAGLRVSCALPRSDVELQSVYGEFTPLHSESWTRTGMIPHRLKYWTSLARAIVDGGGRDIVVFVRDGDGQALAAVTCHMWGDRALYWAGASSERGLAMRANPLCLHAAIQVCRQLGARYFELGRFDARETSRKELAVTRYKAQFGGSLVRIVGFRTEPPLAVLALSRVRRSLGTSSHGST